MAIRAGSDIAFLGGLVNYVLSNERWFKDYVLDYTNASTIIQDGFRDTEDLAGLFSGYKSDTDPGKYDAQEGHWGYAGSTSEHSQANGKQGGSQKEDQGVHGHGLQGGATSHSSPRKDMTDAPEGQLQRDPTLQHPLCVFQILRRHFALHTGNGLTGMWLYSGAIGARGRATLLQLRP